MSDIINRLRRTHEHDGLRLPAEAAARIDQTERENAELRHDVEQYVANCAELATELESVRSQARREALLEAIAMIKARMNSDSQAHDFATIDALRRLAEQEGAE